MKVGGRLEKNDGPRHDVLMQNSTTEPMDASKQFCPNEACSARGGAHAPGADAYVGVAATLYRSVKDVTALAFVLTVGEKQNLRRPCSILPLTYVPTANLLVCRALWQRLGGFAPLTFGEDVDFCRRLLATGSQLIYLPQGVIYHDYRTTLHAFLGIRISYASSEAALLQRHPTERRVLLLPPEQAAFAGLVIGGVWGMVQRGSSTRACGRDTKPEEA